MTGVTIYDPQNRLTDTQRNLLTGTVQGSAHGRQVPRHVQRLNVVVSLGSRVQSLTFFWLYAVVDGEQRIIAGQLSFDELIGAIRGTFGAWDLA